MSHYTLVVGPMFSEKSPTLRLFIQRALRARLRVSVYLSILDTRSGGSIRTHSGLTLDAEGPFSVIPKVIDRSVEIEEDLALASEPPHLVVIEEAQFFDGELPKVIERLRIRYLGIRLVIGGLNLTSEGEPFGPMPELLSRAEKVINTTAICACGEEATRTYYRLGAKSESVAVGGATEYEPRCFACWARGTGAAP